MDRIARIMLVAALAAAMASCGEATLETEPREGAAGQQQDVSVTFSSTGCSLEGSGRVASGRIALTVVNETTDEARIHLWRLEDGHVFADFASFVETEAARIESGKEPLGAPDYVTFMTEIAAQGQASAAGEATVDEGSYGFACFPWVEEDGDVVYQTMYSAGPLEVTS